MESLPGEMIYGDPAPPVQKKMPMSVLRPTTTTRRIIMTTKKGMLPQWYFGSTRQTTKRFAQTTKKGILPSVPARSVFPPQPVPQGPGMSAAQVSAMLNQALPGISGALTTKGSPIPSQISTISSVLLKPLINSLAEINANLGTIAGVAEPLTTWLNTQNGQGGGRRTRYRRGRRSTRRR